MTPFAPASAARQRGVTTLGWLFIVILIAFFTMTAIRLAPVYIENLNVRSALNSLAEAPSLGHSERQIRDALMRRLDVNQVGNVEREDVQIDRRDDRYLVTVDYEVRVPYVANIDLVASFHQQAEVTARE